MTNTSERKIAVVIDNSMPAGLAANTAAVLTLSLGHELGAEVIGPDLVDADGVPHRGITTVPIPILTADREIVRNIRNGAFENDATLVVDFTDCAQRARTYDDYAAALTSKSESELDYLGVVVCGPKKVLQKLTGSLPLLK